MSNEDDSSKNSNIASEDSVTFAESGDTCMICLMPFAHHDSFRLSKCGCIFCRNCVVQYVEVMINEGLVLSITCPDGLCKYNGRLGEEEIESLINIDTYQRYKRIKFDREVDKDPHRTWCPKPGCESICPLPSKSSQSNINTFIVDSRQKIICAECQYQFCSLCKCKWHYSKTCDEAQQETLGGIPFSSDPDAMIKRCPSCRVPIERDAGCAQMLCKNCKHVFCWHCLESLDDDMFLLHYETGPCKNKLGHSRAILCCHRFQVCLIFIGLMLLVLLSAPFLIVAAPFILCWKFGAFRRCRKTDADRPESPDAVHQV